MKRMKVLENEWVGGKRRNNSISFYGGRRTLQIYSRFVNHFSRDTVHVDTDQLVAQRFTDPDLAVTVVCFGSIPFTYLRCLLPSGFLNYYPILDTL